MLHARYEVSPRNEDFEESNGKGSVIFAQDGKDRAVGNNERRFKRLEKASH